MIELHQTQYPGTENKPKRAVFIGLDFGTAFTKVVIAGTSDSFAIKLRPKFSGIDAYLQPGLMAQDTSGKYHLLDGKVEGKITQNLKLTLMQVPDNPLAKANVATFLSLVLQRARSEFMEAHKDKFRNLRLDWHLNIGLPAENFDNKALRDSFKEVANTAWVLSILNCSLEQKSHEISKDIANNSNILRDNEFNGIRSEFIHPDKIGILPEVQAETVCYATSRSRNDGLHLLVDVGAGTLDVNVFALVRPGNADDRYVSHCAKVYKLGTVFLAMHRLNELHKNAMTDKSSFPNYFTEYALIPGRKELAKKLKVDIKVIKVIDRTFLNEVGMKIWDAINEVRQKYDNRVHPWRSKPLPTFLAGGGSLDEGYIDQLNLVDSHRIRYGYAGLDIRPLPKPAQLNLPGNLDNSFHRLAVAFGLAMDLVNLGDFIPTNQLPPPIQPKVTNFQDNYLSKEFT